MKPNLPGRLILILSCIFMLSEALPAQELNKEIDAVMAEFVKLDVFSGTVLLAKEGKILYAGAFGEANKDHHVKNTLQTKFNIGSAGKTFTAVSIMQLAEQGKLSVTDPVITYLPDFPFGDKITIHHLLTHTAGTFNYFAHPDFPARMATIRSVSDALPLIFDQELLFDTPGEQYAYSNSGIVILGAVIEKVSGLSYRDYLHRHILDPLGMTDTDINYWDQIEENRAAGYIKSPTGKFSSNIYTVPPANADGGIETTVTDLLTFDQALYGNELLSEESKEKMFTPFLNGYAYCWRVEENYGNKVVWHGGGAPGVSASFKRYLTDRYTLIVLSNYSGGASEVSSTLEALLFGAPYELPKPILAEFLYRQMRDNGIEQTLQNAEKLLQDNGYRIRSDRELNFLGYTLINEKLPEMALAVFQLNASMFPKVANVWDSLAEGYLLTGDTDSAVRYYQKALEVDPEFTHARQQLERLEGGK